MAAFAGRVRTVCVQLIHMQRFPLPVFPSEAAAGGKPREPAGADDGHVRNLASLADMNFPRVLSALPVSATSAPSI